MDETAHCVGRNHPQKPGDDQYHGKCVEHNYFVVGRIVVVCPFQLLRPCSLDFVFNSHVGLLALFVPQACLGQRVGNVLQSAIAVIMGNGFCNYTAMPSLGASHISESF